MNRINTDEGSKSPIVKWKIDLRTVIFLKNMFLYLLGLALRKVKIGSRVTAE